MEDSIVSSSVRSVIAAALLLLAASSVHAADPISLDAESSTFDRQSSTMIFRRLSITQGTMVIRADEAVATGLDFEEGEWRFEGNVEFIIDQARILADSATIVFAANELQAADLIGSPATFERVEEVDADAEPIRGQANRLSYDNVGRVMRLHDGAWFAQGQNEFRSCDLTFDLDREQITSGSSACGESIFITIVPRDDGDESAGSTTP